MCLKKKCRSISSPSLENYQAHDSDYCLDVQLIGLGALLPLPSESSVPIDERALVARSRNVSRIASLITRLFIVSIQFSLSIFRKNNLSRTWVVRVDHAVVL